MKIGVFQFAVAALIALAAGCIGAFAIGEWREPAHPQTLHDFVHEELDLDASQKERLEQIEARFTVERNELEHSLRAANARLAVAMDEEHEYGPKVAAAIDDVHGRMGDLQKATVGHVFAMRALLKPEQKARFDRQVSLSLTGESDE
ncbi:MAG: periplasmic heavy metal sensor [Sphingomonadales bacterium]|nr:MAG: periplasmic heavy metal sensor [Sphingomonadales bacterium]